MPETYHLRDVRALAEAIEAAAAAPSTPEPLPPLPDAPAEPTANAHAEADEVFANDDDSESDISSSEEPLDDDEEDEEDAADHNFEITFQMGGHIGPLTFGEADDYDHDFDWGAHEHEHEHGDDEDDDYYDDEIYFGEYEEGFYDGMDAHDAEAHCKFPVRAVLNTRM